MDAIRFENVTFKYDDKSIFDKLNLSIPKGKHTVLLGHNGSGKSTFAKIVIGLLDIEKGHVFIDDVELNEDNIQELRKKVCIVFQNPDNQFIGSTVEDDIAFGLENNQVEQSKMKDIIVEFATKVGMEDYLKAEPTALSGGQKQRVAIAGALALNPEILILDEATSMLDPQGRKDIRELVESLRIKNPDMTILSITHHIEEALLADNIIIFNKGKVVATGKPVDVLYNMELLNENMLIPPFVVQVVDKLNKEGINIDKCLSIDELVNKL